MELFPNLYRIYSQEIPRDITVHAGGASFSLHKVKYNLCFFTFKVEIYVCPSIYDELLIFNQINHGLGKFLN